MRDYYAELEVSPEASSGVIAAAYRHLARVHHPDVAGAVGARRMRALNEAYETLRDPERRRAYDASRVTVSAWQPDPWPPPRAVATDGWRPGAGCYLTIIVGALSMVGALWAALLLHSWADGEAAPVVTARGASGARIVTRPEHSVSPSTPTGLLAPASATAVPTSAPAIPPISTTPPPTPEPTPEPVPAAVPSPQPTPEPARSPAPTPSPAPPPVTIYVRHLVQPGENLSRIAERYGISQAVILAINGLTDPDRILFGQELLIPQLYRP